MARRPNVVKACRYCDARVLWAFTRHGKRMCFDADPVRGMTSGAFVLKKRLDGQLQAVHVANPSDAEAYFRAHRATCSHYA